MYKYGKHCMSWFFLYYTSQYKFSNVYNNIVYFHAKIIPPEQSIVVWTLQNAMENERKRPSVCMSPWLSNMCIGQGIVNSKNSLKRKKVYGPLGHTLFWFWIGWTCWKCLMTLVNM